MIYTWDIFCPYSSFYVCFSATEHSNVSVFVGETKQSLILCAFYRGPSAYDDPVKLTCSAPINGRYVKILGNYRTGNQTHKSGGLRLCEVEVYARVIKGM